LLKTTVIVELMGTPVAPGIGIEEERANGPTVVKLALRGCRGVPSLPAMPFVRVNVWATEESRLAAGVNVPVRVAAL
jgi:hypothetical protein